MKKKSVSMLLAFAFTATVLLAQGPPAPPDPAARTQSHVKRLTTLLSLSTAQQQEATTIFTNASRAEAVFHQQFRSAHQSLDAAVKSNNGPAIDQIAITLGNLSAQSTAVRAKAEAAFYQILSPEQQQKFNEFQSEGPRGFVWFGGPGGPGPMPH